MKFGRIVGPCLYIVRVEMALRVLGNDEQLCSSTVTCCDVQENRLVYRMFYTPVRRGQLKLDGTRAEIRFRLSAKLTSSFKSTGASVRLTTGSRDVHISGSNAGYIMFRGSVKSTGYPLHSPVSP
jgi:hypothetical protein